MVCPLCKLAGYIVSSKYVLEDDNTDEKETKLYMEQRFACRNVNCSNNEKEIGSVKNPIEIK